jgi:hypothetical protein
MPQYPSLNGRHPFTSNPDGRGKKLAHVASKGRGRGRGGQSFHTAIPAVSQLSTRPPVPVGTQMHGQLMCPACRSQVTTLVRQSAASTHPWVCTVWCSPRDPRREHFISTRHTNR